VNVEHRILILGVVKNRKEIQKKYQQQQLQKNKIKENKRKKNNNKETKTQKQYYTWLQIV
jgi:hypothetical protein